MKSLSFEVLRAANLQRLPLFKNAKGERAHASEDGSDWTRSDWLEAATGELGEYANVSKKFRRGDINEVEFRELARKELADVVTYLDILAYRIGINLGDAVREKFNAVSNRVGVSIYISESNEVVRDCVLIRD